MRSFEETSDSFIGILRAEVDRRTFAEVASRAPKSELSDEELVAELQSILDGNPPGLAWPKVSEGVLASLDAMAISQSWIATKVFLGWAVTRWFPNFQNTTWSKTEVLGVLVNNIIELNTNIRLSAVDFVKAVHAHSSDISEAFLDLALIIIWGSIVADTIENLPAVVAKEAGESIQMIVDDSRWLLNLDWRGARGAPDWEEAYRKILRTGGGLDHALLMLRNSWLARPS